MVIASSSSSSSAPAVQDLVTDWNSVSFTFTDIPVRADIELTPDVTYQTTEEDVQLSYQLGFAAYNVIYEQNTPEAILNGDAGTEIAHLQYFVPYVSLPSDVQATLQTQGLMNPAISPSSSSSSSSYLPEQGMAVSIKTQYTQAPTGAILAGFKDIFSNVPSTVDISSWFKTFWVEGGKIDQARQCANKLPAEVGATEDDVKKILEEIEASRTRFDAALFGSGLVMVTNFVVVSLTSIAATASGAGVLVIIGSVGLGYFISPNLTHYFKSFFEEQLKREIAFLESIIAICNRPPIAAGDAQPPSVCKAGFDHGEFRIYRISSSSSEGGGEEEEYFEGEPPTVLDSEPLEADGSGSGDESTTETFRLYDDLLVTVSQGTLIENKEPTMPTIVESPSITYMSAGNAMPPLPSLPPPPSSSNCLPTTTQPQQPPSQQPPEIITPSIPPVTDQPPIVESPPPSPPSPIQSVNATNNPPSAFDDTVTTTINMPIAIKLTASDPDRGDKLTTSITLTPSNGMLGNIDQGTHTVTYSPNPGFTGTDSFMFKVNDGKADSNTALVTIAILTQDEWLATTQSTTPLTTTPGTNSQPASNNENSSPANDATSSSTTTITTTTTTEPNAVDQDGDGFTSAEKDCDDSNPNAFPAAIELAANSVDDDCNGIVDDIDSSNSGTTTTTTVLPTSEENTTISISTEFAQLVEEGVNLSNLGRYDEAIEYFDRALEIDPNDSTTLYNKGTALNDKGVELAELGRYDEAIEYFDRALEIDPNDSTTLSNKETALVNKASDLAELGRYDEAMEVIDEALSILPDDDVALSNKGVYLSQLGNYDEAIEYFDRALAINPGNTEASDSRDAVIDMRDNGGTLEMSTTNTTEEGDTDTSGNATRNS